MLSLLGSTTDASYLVGQTPKVLQQNIDEIRSYLDDKNAPIGVDLLIPQVGGKARKTNVRRLQLSVCNTRS